MHTNTFCKYRKNYSHRLACILLHFKVIFLKTTILNLGRAHREKFYRDCFGTEHIYPVKGCVHDDDFIFDKMYHILKL